MEVLKREGKLLREAAGDAGVTSGCHPLVIPVRYPVSPYVKLSAVEKPLRALGRGH